MSSPSTPKSLWTLWYPASYLTFTGVALLAAPGVALRLLFSTGDYGEVMPRMAGALALVLGVLVVQTIRFGLDVLVPTLIYARVFFCTVWLCLFGLNRDPFFLVVFGVVAAGLVWTWITWILERRGHPEPASPG